jgi:hypothetical protein
MTGGGRNDKWAVEQLRLKIREIREDGFLLSQE